MTVMQEQAIEIIKRLPDEKIFYVVNILEGIEGLTQNVSSTKAQTAYQNLQRFRKCGTVERSYKEELQEALIERYESIR